MVLPVSEVSFKLLICCRTVLWNIFDLYSALGRMVKLLGFSHAAPGIGLQ